MAKGEGSTWEDWCTDLERIVGDHYGPLGPIAECGELGWRSYFEDGLSPLAAFVEDLLHPPGDDDEEGC